MAVLISDIIQGAWHLYHDQEARRIIKEFPMTLLVLSFAMFGIYVTFVGPALL